MSRAGRRGGAARRQRGVALVIVLWLGVLLAVIANGLATTLRSEARVAGNRLDVTEARYLAEAALVRSLLELESDAAESRQWREGKVETRRFSLFDGHAEVRLQPAAGLLDVNTASADWLDRLFQVAGVGPSRRERLVDAILDWRDVDDLRRLNGAEASDYRDAGLDYGPRNGPFRHLHEVRQVLGVDAALFDRLLPNLTLWSNAAQPAQRVAPRPLLLALLEGDEARVDAYLRTRDALPVGDVQGALHLRIDAVGRGGGRSSIEAVVENDSDAGWRVLFWRDAWRLMDDG